MKSFEKSGENASTNGWDNIRKVREFSQEQAEINRQKALVEKEKKQIIGEFSGGEFECYKALNEDSENRIEREYLSEIPRPVDSLFNGYRFDGSNVDKYEAVCKAGFNLCLTKMDQRHFRRILASAVGEDPMHPENVNSMSYEKFVGVYPTIADYQEQADMFMNSLRGNSEEKIREYRKNIEKFQELLFGQKQVIAHKAFLGLKKEAKNFSPEESTFQIPGQNRGLNPNAFAPGFWDAVQDNAKWSQERSKKEIAVDEDLGANLEESEEKPEIEKNDEVKVGDKIGNGYRVVVAHGFERIDPEFPLLPDQRYMFHKGKYYIVVRER